ncbi:hypothetical protein ACFQ6E_39060 [Streptomyces sp. NPDC056462]|uniref:hypothetical protein n=1 Tax=Streptomyces sp. NPDC056462 TaxID=3345826 RepID=UPI003694949E
MQGSKVIKLVTAAMATVALGLFTNWASEESAQRWWWTAAAGASALLVGAVATPGIARTVLRRRPVDMHLALPRITARRSGAHWALPGPLQGQDLERANRELDLTNIYDELTPWVYARGGADVGLVGRRITFQGAGQPATITGMRARILTRSPILAGTIVVVGLGGGDDTLSVSMNLDEDDPTADYFSSHVVNIAADETVVVDLYTRISSSTATWDLEIDFVVQGRLRTVTVPSKDACMRITGRAGCDGSGDEPPGYHTNDHYGTCLYAFRDRGLEPWVDPMPM